MLGEEESRYVYSPQHITNILKKIQSTGRPEKLTLSYVKKTWLFQNNNYSAVLVILKDMEFISNEGIPLDRYAKFQNQKLQKMQLLRG